MVLFETLNPTIGVTKGILGVQTMVLFETLNPIIGVTKGDTRSLDYGSF